MKDFKTPPLSAEDAHDERMALMYGTGTSFAPTAPVEAPATHEEVLREGLKERGLAVPPLPSTAKDEGAAAWVTLFKHHLGASSLHDVVKEYIAQHSHPSPHRVRIAVEAWDELAKRPGLEISFNGFGEEDGWVVHRVTGGVNDREWEELACADTPLEALQEALAALKEGK